MTSHRGLNRKINAHYSHPACTKNLASQALSYFVVPSPHIQSYNPQVICQTLHVKVLWSSLQQKGDSESCKVMDICMSTEETC